MEKERKVGERWVQTDNIVRGLVEIARIRGAATIATCTAIVVYSDRSCSLQQKTSWTKNLVLLGDVEKLRRRVRSRM